MTQERAFDPVGETAANLGLEDTVVHRVIDEFMLQLHRDLVEYEGVNGDYIGESLSHHLSHQAFFHLLGFLDRFTERYGWQPGSAGEYLGRLGSRADWLSFAHQQEGWAESSRYGRRRRPATPEGSAS